MSINFHTLHKTVSDTNESSEKVQLISLIMNINRQWFILFREISIFICEMKLHCCRKNYRSCSINNHYVNMLCVYSYHETTKWVYNHCFCFQVQPFLFIFICSNFVCNSTLDESIENKEKNVTALSCDATHAASLARTCRCVECLNIWWVCFISLCGGD